MLLVARAATTSPLPDEDFVANPAWNLATHGFMGTTNVHRPQWPDIDRYTFNTLPVGILTTSLTFKLIGFSLFSSRIPSMLSALAALAAIYLIARGLDFSRGESQLSVILVALDCHFIGSATSGRADMMTLSLGLLAQAAYLWLRNRNLNLAISVGFSLIALACMAHPAGIFFAGFLGALVFYLDRGRIAPRHLVLASLPFVAALMAWLPYYWLKPDSAWLQLTANFQNHRGPGGMRALIALPLREIPMRYVHSSLSAGIMAALYCLGLAGMTIWPRMRRNPATRLLLCETLLLAGALALDSMKMPEYIVYLVPFFGMMVACGLRAIWEVGGTAKLVTVAFVTFAFASGVGSVARQISRDEYHRQDIPAAQFLRSRTHASDLVSVDTSFGFVYGFDYNAVHFYGNVFTEAPRFVVNNKELAQTPRRARRAEETNYAQQTLREFHCIYRSPKWFIYQRNE
jgi:4-amino-4-deoxy-L-arabinose transferase-like glycosyltransferase